MRDFVGVVLVFALLGILLFSDRSWVLSDQRRTVAHVADIPSAEAARLVAEGEAEAAKLRAEADRVRFEVEAAGQRAVNEAANLLSSDQISLQTKLALLKVLPEVIRESVKPMEAIDSIKIVQVDGLTAGGGAGSASAGAAGQGDGNLADNAVAAALRYRAQAPMLDGLMKELGFSGGSLDGLVKSVADAPKEKGDAADPA